MKMRLKKAAASLMISAMLLSFGACGADSKYSLSNIKLTETQRYWSNPEAKYSALTELYSGSVCAGTLVVATDKDIIYLYAEDATEKDGKTVTSQDTVFDIASCSKTFTAVAVLQLVEKGKLDLYNTLDKFFPEYETGKKITVNDLLHMRSGIPDYCNNPDPFWNISGAEAADKKLSEIYLDKTTDEEFMQSLYKAPLGFEPGTQYEYSNSNYHLLAFIIEKVSGMKYCDYVKKNIFDKCGMKKTTSMATGDMTYQPVEFDELVQYGFSDKDGYPACPNNCRGDGGIHSCLTDMVAFDRALFTGKLLNKNSMEILLKAEEGYCCGLMKEKDGYSHDGSSMSCHCNNRIIESEEYGHIYVITMERNNVIPKLLVDDPMTGTKYTKGAITDGMYTNEYAGLKLKVAEGFAPISEDEMKASWADALKSASDIKEKKRMLATKFDTWLWNSNSGDAIMVSFLNTKLAFPGNSGYSEEDFLNDYIKGYEEYNIVKKEISKVTLGGNEYSKAEVAMEFNGKNNYLYLYVRKLDDNLMAEIEIGGASNKKADYFESLFS